MCAEGRGVPKDDKLAVEWYRKAADQGNATAQFLLGAMYAEGCGVPKDLILGYVWISLGAANGFEGAKENRDRIEKLMTRDQIAEAQKLAREYWQKQQSK